MKLKLDIDYRAFNNSYYWVIEADNNIIMEGESHPSTLKDNLFDCLSDLISWMRIENRA